MLQLLFNLILSSGIYPQAWTLGVIVPLHKKGSVDQPCNYRPITLLDVCGKIFSKILCSRLTEWATHENKISWEQAGFRKGFQTIDNIYIISAVIRKYLALHKGRLYCAFIDFKAAFDSVSHSGLLYKLWVGNVKGRVFNVIRNMYKNVKACVSLQQGYTEFFDCAFGVRQGCQLSPFLFSFFINDIVQYLGEDNQWSISIGMIQLFILSFADDIIILDSSVVGLQKRLDKLSTYCDKWQLLVNSDKSKVIIFRKGGRLRKYEKFYFKKDNLEIVSSYKYLGVQLSSSGSWYQAQKTLTYQANKALQCIRSSMTYFNKLPLHVQLHIFDVKVMPILTYGS